MYHVELTSYQLTLSPNVNQKVVALRQKVNTQTRRLEDNPREMPLPKLLLVPPQPQLSNLKTKSCPEKNGAYVFAF